jgi:hypothetical protein
LETALLVTCDVLAELSTDGGASWRPLVRDAGITMGIDAMTGLPRTSYHLNANWDPPLSAGRVRVTIDNAVAFASSGGSVVVT